MVVELYAQKYREILLKKKDHRRLSRDSIVEEDRRETVTEKIITEFRCKRGSS